MFTHFLDLHMDVNTAPAPLTTPEQPLNSNSSASCWQHQRAVQKEDGKWGNGKKRKYLLNPKT